MDTIHYILHRKVQARFLTKDYDAILINDLTTAERQHMLDSGWYEIIEGQNKWTNKYLDNR